MAEVLGTISAALQVAELGGRLSVKLCTVAHKFKNANKALRSLSNDVALTCSVLRQLSDSLGQDDLVSLYSPAAFATAQDVLEECKKVFKDLESEIEQQHPDPASSKSRMERATRKIWFLMNEPRLDAVAGNLERLKSTMLLMLNVVIYAGQLRSRREVNKSQEQRELLQILAVEKNESERKFAHLTTSIQLINLNVQNHAAGSSSQLQDNFHKTGDELQHYYNMVKAVLDNIDTAQLFLDGSRYQRLKDGFISLHHAEAQGLGETYGTRASQLFSQLGITPPQPQMPPPETVSPISRAKKRKKAPSYPVSSNKPSLEHPPSKLVSDTRVPDTSYVNLDFSSLDNQDVLENFDFDTFLNTEGKNTGFGFDPEAVPYEATPDQPPLKQKEKTHFDPKGSHTVEDTSPEDPDVWVLRWTTLEKTELHQ